MEWKRGNASKGVDQMRMRMRVFFFLLSNRFANTVETFTSQTHFCCFLPNFIILFLKPLL